MSSLGVVVPAYRPDADALETYLREIVHELDPVAVRLELDAPDAATLEAVGAFELPRLEVDAVPYRRGKGAAVTAGFEALDADRLAFADADGSTPAPEFARIVDALDGADLAVGSRRHPDAHVVGHQTFLRRFMGDGFAWLARRLLDARLYDYQCGAKALTASAWETVRMHIYQAGFAWDVELVAMAGALDLRIAEVPIEWEDQPGSTVSPIRSSASMAKALFVARHRAKRLQDSQFHETLARRGEPTALVDRDRGG